MLIEILTGWVFDMLNWILNLFPTLSLPTYFVDTMDDLWDLIATVGFFIPLPAVVVAIQIYAIWFAVEWLVTNWHFFKGKIPFLHLK